MDEEFRQITAKSEDAEPTPTTNEKVDVDQLIHVEDGPHVSYVVAEPGAVFPRHYHNQNQWQVILEGSCTMEGEELSAFSVHYTKANTEYGPIVAGDEGFKMMTLREKPAGYYPVDEDENTD